MATKILKPKTKKGERVLAKRAPKLDENPKNALLLFGGKTSAVIKNVISELYTLKRFEEQAKKLTRNNENIRPFEGGMEQPLERLAQQHDCSMFAFASHSKKRPHNLVLGRMFDHHLYDMVELGVDRFRSLKEFPKVASQVMAGSKPCFAFAGQEFETKPEYKLLKNILLDFFRGTVVKTVNLRGLDRVYVVVAAAGKVRIRHCVIKLKKSGSTVPRIELEEMGPSMDLTVRRHRPPSDDLSREALKMAPKPTKKKVKNTAMDSLAGKVGRIYMPKQEVDKLGLSKMKGLKRERRDVAAEKSRNVNGGVSVRQGKPPRLEEKPSAKRRRIREDPIR
ncbi:hypothetical protein KFL_000470160 [Klebsormidium nitens]|uniref:Ribosome production factor 2 homolog n=1 Tax=Klebsormidium nitens TaxID=105231 RepID=A0A1Y1HQS2_KLENI|nr:hypothetical protein KFL_000470160 [Klebsormidium nitens]|eukprot:GAQ80142.1 hypothetical protein KFL_000470160 [Klebsormidium nitens]